MPKVAPRLFVFLFVLFTACDAEAISISVQTSKTLFSQNEAVQAIITIKNEAKTPVNIPVLNEFSKKLYISLAVNTAAGSTVSLIPALSDEPTPLKPNAFQTLSPGGEISIQEVLNEDGRGFFGLADLGAGKQLQRFTGILQITAVFSVTDQNLPLHPSKNTFVGTIKSSPANITVNEADVNNDGVINCTDVAIVKAVLGKKCGQKGYNTYLDINRDCVIDEQDLSIVLQKLTKEATCH